MPIEIQRELIAHACRESPLECCGLLAGSGETVTHHLPLVNELASATCFRSEPRSMFDAMKTVRQLKVDILAVYHSHPASIAVPSLTDIAEANWPGLATVIVSLQHDVPVLRAWMLDDPPREIPIAPAPTMNA
jgi:proteasome lid subunit RPN8/RPN11